MPAALVGDDQVCSARSVAIVDLETIAEHWKVPLQEIDEYTLARSEHRSKHDMLMCAARLIHDEHPACLFGRTHRPARVTPHAAEGPRSADGDGCGATFARRPSAIGRRARRG
jgi:hypothetical protein